MPQEPGRSGTMGSLRATVMPRLIVPHVVRLRIQRQSANPVVFSSVLPRDDGHALIRCRRLPDSTEATTVPQRLIRCVPTVADSGDVCRPTAAAHEPARVTIAAASVRAATFGCGRRRRCCRLPPGSAVPCRETTVLEQIHYSDPGGPGPDVVVRRAMESASLSIAVGMVAVFRPDGGPAVKPDGCASRWSNGYKGSVGDRVTSCWWSTAGPRWVCAPAGPDGYGVSGGSLRWPSRPPGASLPARELSRSIRVSAQPCRWFNCVLLHTDHVFLSWPGWHPSHPQ